MNRQFGMRFDGLGNRIEEILKEYLIDNKEFTYFEIGVGEARTFRTIYDITKENIKHNDWFCFGLDLTNGWSTNLETTNKLFTPEELIIYKEGESAQEATTKLLSDKFHAALILRDNPREYIKRLDDNSIDISLIDASHGYNSVQADFLAIKDKIKIGGILLFHDFCVLCQGTDWQTVDNDFINVRRALGDLGLMDGKYPNWTFKGEILGSRFQNLDGNGVGVFQKI